MISGSWSNDPEIGLVQIECVKIQEISIVGRFFMYLTPMRSSIFHKVHQYSQPQMSGFRSSQLFLSGSFLFVIVFKSKAWPKTSKTLHPWSLTWNLKIISWKRRFLLETILFRFHVKLQGVQTDTSNWSIVMPRSSVFGIRIGGVVLKAEKFARTWRLEKWKGVVGTPNNKFQEVNMSRFFWHWVFYVATAAGFFDVFFWGTSIPTWKRRISGVSPLEEMEKPTNSKETLKRSRSFSTIKALLKPFWTSPETPGHF